MSLAIVGKIGASIAFLGTSSIVGCVLIKPELFGIHSDVDMYVISVKVDGGATEALTDKNFKCKFAGSDVADAFDCEVFKLKTKTEKHYEINHLSSNLDTRPTVTELKTAHTVFKIKFSGKYWGQEQPMNKNIEIIHTETDNKKYVDLKPLFAKHKGKVIEKTNYFVAKAVGETIGVTTANTFKCWFDGQSASKLDCTITEFSSAESSSLTEQTNYTDSAFTKPTSPFALTTITQHKHYLIQFTGDDNKQEVKGFKHEKIHLSVVDATPTPTQKTEFKNVKPSFYDDNYDGLFIV